MTVTFSFLHGQLTMQRTDPYIVVLQYLQLCRDCMIVLHTGACEKEYDNLVVWMCDDEVNETVELVLCLHDGIVVAECDGGDLSHSRGQSAAAVGSIGSSFALILHCYIDLHWITQTLQ